MAIRTGSPSNQEGTLLVRLSISIIPAAVLAVFAAAPAAMASAPSPFPVYDSGSALITAHPVTSGERLIIAGRPVTLASVAHPGPAYVSHVQGVAPVSWRGKTLAAISAP
jgi:hypothetical protein